jgi:Flp pilus assembly protein TadD
MALGDLEGAEQDLRRTLELAPDHTAAMNDLAVLLMSAGAHAEARRLLERVLELRPEDPLARRNLERLERDSL